MNRPSVTIAICNYNREQYVSRAIRSAMSQIANQRLINIIVIDDCSTDNSLQVINEFCENIFLHKFVTNKGIGFASNYAVEMTNTDYFMRLDSDDYLSNESIGCLAAILDNNQDIDFVYGDLLKINRDGFVDKRIRLDSRQELLLHGAGILFRTQSILDVGSYDKTLRNAEDMDLLVKLENNKKQGLHIPIPHYRYYNSHNNLTDNKDRELYIEEVKKRHDF